MIAYLDNAATTRIADDVRSAVDGALRESFGNPSSLHAAGRAARRSVEDARERIASALGADPKEILFTSGATESDNLALFGVCEALRGRGNHVVTSAVEHPAILETCRTLERRGFEISRVPVDGQGRVDPAAVEEAVTSRTVLISIMWVNNEVGTVQPIAEIARSKRALLHTDAAQAVGKVRVSLDGIGLLTFSGHKIHGPKGIGGLFVRKGTPLAPLLVGGGQEFEKRAGTENVPWIAGLACAVETAVRRQSENAARMESLRERLRRGLERIPDSHANGHPSERAPGILNVSFDGVDGEAVVLALDAKGICVSTGSACASLGSEPSHVLRAMGMSPDRIRSSVRLSVASDTTDKEIDGAVEIVPGVVERLRRISPVYGGGKP